MELIDQLHALENEVKLVKGEIKKVLVDLREVMSTTENPFAYLEQLRLDEERIKHLEEAAEQLKALGGGNGFDEERLRTVEEAVEQVKQLVTGILEERVKHLEDTVEELKEQSAEAEKLKYLEDTVQELKEQSDAEAEKQKQVESAIEMMTEPENQSESMLVRRSTLNSELHEFGMVVRDEFGNEVVDAITLAQLIQWADTTVNLIGREKLNQVVELLELTGRVSKETKDTIFKIAKLPDMVQTPEKEHVEARHCIVALFELNRILTGRHQELSTLLKDAMLRNTTAK